MRRKLDRGIVRRDYEVKGRWREEKRREGWSRIGRRRKQNIGMAERKRGMKMRLEKEEDE